MNEQVDIVEKSTSEPDTSDLSDLNGPKPMPDSRAARLWLFLIVGILIVFIWFLAVGLQRENLSGQRADGLAPDFEFTSFDGETIRLADLEGQGIVLNFWASWCDPCRSEAAMLEQAWRREAGNGIVFLGLDYLDQEHAALAYLEEFDITYPNGPDLGSRIYRRYGSKGVPETFFIAPDGTVADIVIGPLLNEAALERRLALIRP